MPQGFALLLHGRLGSWFASASELPDAQRSSGKPAMLSSPAAMHAFAAFTHRSLWQHIVLPTRASGATLTVVMHSWSPEVGSTLDRLYQPALSKHEQPRSDLDKVASQHQSLRRALELLERVKAPPAKLVMVARLDLLLFTDIDLTSLSQSLRSPPDAADDRLTFADVLYLPHTCVPSRLRLPPPLSAEAEGRVLRRTCSGSVGDRGEPTGRRMLPTQLTRYNPTQKFRELSLSDDFTTFVLDYFFIGTRRVAYSFGRLADELPAVSQRLRRRFHTRRFPQWSHLYWAEHITHTLAPAGVQLRFVLHHEVDFNLARFWRYGADCITQVRRSAHTSITTGARHADRRHEHEHADALALLFANVSAFAQQLRAEGEDALRSSPLRDQCPHQFADGTDVLCPWFSRACRSKQLATLAMAEAAGRFQAKAGLPPRQLMNAERCHTRACVTYNGTARKHRRSDQREAKAYMSALHAT